MLADATYTPVCQRLAFGWVYRMSYAEMDTWRADHCHLDGLKCPNAYREE